MLTELLFVALCVVVLSISICLSSTSTSFVACWGFNSSLFMVLALLMCFEYKLTLRLLLFHAFLRRSFEALEMSLSVRTFHRFIGIPPSTDSSISAKAFAEFHRANRSAVIRKFKLRKVQESFSCSNQISHLVSSGPRTHSSGFGEVNISVAMKARKNEQEQIKLICRHVQWLGCLLVYADVETFN